MRNLASLQKHISLLLISFSYNDDVSVHSERIHHGNYVGIEVTMRIGIRREDKNRWEGRVPLVPDDIRELIQETDLAFSIQPSTIRSIPDEAYRKAGVDVSEDLSSCDIIFAVKEIPEDLILPEKTYVFFSHVIKAQSYNMPMLKRLMDKGCTLIDYEKMIDDKGRRLIFFGRFAGAAGMVDTLWALGQRHKWEGCDTPFSRIMPAHHYGDTTSAKQALCEVAFFISAGISSAISPIIIGISGYGHVSQGAQEMLNSFPVEEVPPAALPSLRESGGRNDRIYISVFKEEDLVEPIGDDRFDLQDYYENPGNYRSVFHRYWPYMTVFVNAVYWDERYPRMITKNELHERVTSPIRPWLKVIGDISCDIEGAVECTVRATSTDEPLYVYDPIHDSAIPGIAGCGPVIMAVDNLPCEFPTEASEEFSRALYPFVPAIGKADYGDTLAGSNLPDTIKRATILWRGHLTEEYSYLKDHV